MDLAEKGNNLNLDQTDREVMMATEDTKDTGGHVYSDWGEETANRPVFIWGKAVGKKLCEYNLKQSSWMNCE